MLGTEVQFVDRVSATMLNMAGAINTTNTAFQTLQSTSAQGIDGGAMAALANNVNTTTQAVRGLGNQLEPIWNTQSHMEIFDTSGAERFQSELSATSDAIDDIVASQRLIGNAALQVEILPPNASWDINYINQRIEEMAAKLANLQSQDVSMLDGTAIEKLNSEYEAIRANLNSVTNLQAQMNQAIDAGDVSGLNAGFTQLNDTAEQLERRIRSNMSAIREMSNVQWNSPQNFDVFGGSGVERYRQEIQSANEMITQLAAAQQQIQQRAANTTLFPANMVNDLSNMNNRVDRLNLAIQRIQTNPLNSMHADKVNNEVERLRSQLNQAIAAQNSLNSAMDNMDITTANTAYERLHSIVMSTEQNIRNNTNAQGQFSQALDASTGKANDLKREITGIVAAYVSLRGAEKVLDTSDVMTSNTARLNLMNDGLQTTAVLNDKVFLSAERAHAEYTQTAQTVSKLGLMAGKAFSGNDEIIAFTELMNKNFIVGGSSIQEQTSAMYQLTQAMAAGKLQGDEYRSIMENAPLLYQSIEQYMQNAGVSGTMKEWAADGLITAEVIKGALFSSADQVNERFEKMPMTFAQIGNHIKNNFLMEFQPVLTRLNEIGNSEAFTEVVDKITASFAALAGIATWAVELFVDTGQFISENWSLIAPVVYGVAAAVAAYGVYLGVTNTIELISKGIKLASCIASYAKAAATGAEVSATAAATAAQWGLNTALLASPITWIVIVIIALIAVFYLAVAAINKFSDSSVSATGLIFGAFYTLGAFLWNLFLGLLDLVFAVINSMVNPFIKIANFIGNVFHSPVSSIIYLFQGMADGVLATLEKIASATDFVLGTNMADSVAGWRAGLKDMADQAVTKYAPNENYQTVIDELDLSAEGLGLKRWEYSDAWQKGYETGENLQEKVSNFDLASLFDSNIPNAEDYLEQTADNTSVMKNAMSDAGEDLKYLRDIAERDVVNRFTTAEVKVEFGDIYNHVNSDMDLDGMVSYMEERVSERLQVVADGVSDY
jgi:tape measure domain-containing protein